MSKAVLVSCVGVLSVVCTGSASAFDAFSSIPYAMGRGTPDLDVRLRYEGVYQSSIDEPADALTASTRLGYTTGSWNAFDSQIQLEDVSPVGQDNYNSSDNGKTQYPLVPDPTGANIDQAWIGYSGLPHTVIRFGRQRIIYDDARFIGNVGWRQHEQTYDGLTLTGTWLPKLTFNYAFLTNVNAFKDNTINGVNTRNIDLDGSQLFNLAYAPLKALKLVGYGYLLNFAYDPPTSTLNNPRRDTATYGLRATGQAPVDAVTFSYTLEAAHQSDYADSPTSIDANYYLAEAGTAWKQVNGLVGYEVLGGDGHYGFQTPLATLHAFQGWADQFLTTPAAGIRDFYVNLGGKVEKVALTAVWHDYNSDDASAARYGSEVDLLATRPLGKNFSVGAKFAKYNPDHYPVAKNLTYDTSKCWFWIEYKL